MRCGWLGWLPPRPTIRSPWQPPAPSWRWECEVTMPSDASPEAGMIAAGAADDPVPGWVQAEAAADVSQLTWLRLLENLGRIRDPQRLAGLLATTCRRECLAFLRRSRPATPVADEHLDRLLGGSAAADLSILAADQNATLWQAFLQLSEWCQRVLRALVLDAEDGPPSYRLVAAELQVPVGSLGPTRARCLSQLRKLLVNGGI